MITTPQKRTDDIRQVPLSSGDRFYPGGPLSVQIDNRPNAVIPHFALNRDLDRQTPLCTRPAVGQRPKPGSK